MHTWDLWYPDAASRGLLFARGAMEPADVILVHAAPANLRVEVTGDDARRLAFADNLALHGQRYPMTRLRTAGGAVTREDGWPTAEDIGRPVLLPGGEVGILKEWWNAPDGSEWRWSVEFYNHT